MRFSVRLFICFLLLAAVLLAEKFTNADTALQNLFYLPETHEWLINPALHQKLSPVFYKGLKFLLAATGAGCLIFLLLSLKKPSLAVRRRPVLILLLSIVFVPLVVAGAKYFTNVYCPYQLNIYNGLYPFVRIIDSYPESFVQPKPGRCFPAGHATAGFAFMALYFVFDSRRGKILGLLAGILLGLAAGFYQMLRGQPFLSHTLFSMIASFAVIITIDWFVRKNTKK